MTYSDGQGRQLSDEEFDEYFEEVYAHENNPGDRDVIEFFTELDTLDDTSTENSEEE